VGLFLIYFFDILISGVLIKNWKLKIILLKPVLFIEISDKNKISESFFTIVSRETIIVILYFIVIIIMFYPNIYLLIFINIFVNKPKKPPFKGLYSVDKLFTYFLFF